MSLINEMLKNLEKRNGQDPNHYSIKNPAIEEESSVKWIVCIGSTVAALILIGIIGLDYYEKHSAHKRTIPQEKIILSPSVIRVNQIHINDLPDQTAVILDLNGTTNFTTQADLPHNTETITLNNTWLEAGKLCKQLGKAEDCLNNNDIPLPVNTAAIKSIHINKNDGKQLTLLFTLNNTGKMLDAQLKENSLKITFSNTGSDPSLLSASAPLPLPSDIETNTSSDESLVILQPTTESTNNIFTKYDQIDTYILLKQFDKAKDVVRQLTPEERNSKSGLMLQAKLELALGDNAEALNILNRFPFGSKNPPPEFYALYAATLEFNSRHAEAVTIYKNLIKESPENTVWLLGFAIAAQNDHQYSLAKNNYQKLLDIQDINPEIQNYAEQQIEKINLENQ